MNGFDVEFKIEALDGVLERLKVLPERFQRTGVRRAARKAMNLVRDAARARASRLDDPATAEQIAKNIVTQESGKAGRREGGIVMRVGVLGGASRKHGKNDVRKGNPGGDTRHWLYLEIGSETTPAQSFMRKSLANNVGAVTDTLVEELNIELDRLGA